MRASFWWGLSLALVACEGATQDHDHEHSDEPEPTPSAFALRFAATFDGETVGCGDTLTGLGPDGEHSVGTADLRFYVSNIVFLDAAGEVVEATLDEDEFQHQGTSGWVGLVDLTGNELGDCVPGAISFSEGTARVHEAITGTTLVEEVASVSFDVGVPQPLMKEVIAANTIEGAPSPMAEMYWSWASGYRHFVWNLTVSDGIEEGEGYLHVGSLGCGDEGELALESKAACDLVNTPKVAIDGFDLAADTVQLDLRKVLEGMNFLAPIYDPVTFEVIGEQTGVECHSFPGQEDCVPMFTHLGIDQTTGAADASTNVVFGAM